MLEVKLGPGMLSKNLDGLQDDLNKMHGMFLSRGDYTDPLDNDAVYYFTPLAKVGDELSAGDWIARSSRELDQTQDHAPLCDGR
jgi:V/A-type H+-transporting ATPase subunit A